MVSGVTSVAPRRWKKRMGKKKARSEMVPVQWVLIMAWGPVVAMISLEAVGNSRQSLFPRDGLKATLSLGPTAVAGPGGPAGRATRGYSRSNTWYTACHG